jgi:acetyltransferase-like isoleucine patch superfamily enzyme
VASSSSTEPPYKAARRRLNNAKRLLSGAVRAKFSGAESFGGHADMRGRVRFKLQGRAVFGRGFIAEGDISTVSIVVRENATLIIGDDVYMNYGVTIEACHEIRVGNHVLMAPLVSIIDDNRHETEPGAVLYKGPIVIGNNVWLARNVAVIPGASIGDGCVVAANSVVCTDIPPNSLAAGAPARVIRKLDLPTTWVRS